MKKGEKSEFIIDPEYAYGNNTYDNLIPPNSTINFENKTKKVLTLLKKNIYFKKEILHLKMNDRTKEKK